VASFKDARQLAAAFGVSVPPRGIKDHYGSPT
jgi:hypothetical protein